jgi:hypothetical protein
MLLASLPAIAATLLLAQHPPEAIADILRALLTHHPDG